MLEASFDKSMKILTLNYEYPPIGGGGGAVSKDICEILAEEGHEVTVVTMKYGNQPEYENINGVKVIRVRCLRTSESVCHPWEQMTYIISSCCYLNKHLKKIKYDICHAHFIIPTGVIALWLKKKYGLKYIITVHGSDVPGHNDKRFKILHVLLKKPWRYIVKNAYKVIALSKYLQGLLKKALPGLDYAVIPNGVKTAFYINDIPKDKYILYMGRLQETKGVQCVIQAFSKLGRNEWKLKIVGDGPYRNELEKLCKELNVIQNVEFYGWVPKYSQIQQELLAKAEIYVSASRFENCPISLLEARASGAKVVLSEIDAHKEFGGERAFYFKVDDVKDLKEQLLNAIESSYTYDGESFEYDWNKSVEQYKKLYQEIIS